MTGFFSHNAITAKIRVLYGKRITKSEYGELLKKVTVNEIAAFLKETKAYKEVLENVDSSLLHRGQLESLLRRSFFNEQLSILKFSQNEDTAFLKNLISKYEIEQILSFFNFLKSKRTNEFIYSVPDYIVEYSKINLTGISGCSSFEEFKELISGTEYESIFRNYIPENDNDYSSLEKLLYSFYYAKIFKNIDKFSSYKANVKTFYLHEIEILNFIHILRLKKYYKATPSDIEKHIIPFSSKKAISLFKEIIDAPDDVLALEILCKSKYSKFFANKDFNVVEQYLLSFTYDISKQNLVSGKASNVIPLAYLNFKDIEIHNIICIIEGKRYGVPSEEIKGHLIGI
ncbi:MAG: V-type ATPase subunit [Clostridia bacterium]